MPLRSTSYRTVVGTTVSSQTAGGFRWLVLLGVRVGLATATITPLQRRRRLI